MHTFYTLLKKELRELITWQVVIPMLLTTVLFFALGNVLNKEQEKAKSSQPIILVDNDASPTSAVLTDTLGKANFAVRKTTEQDPHALVHLAVEEKAQVVVVLPQGFGQQVAGGEQVSITTYSVLNNFSLVANRSSVVLEEVIKALNTYFGNQLITLNSNLDPAPVREPIKATQFVAVGDNIAEGNVALVLGFVTAQTTFIPIILFFVIIFAAQMIATAVASEKENKTLETLLTMPISRKLIVSAKMMAAGIVALLASGIYLVGFRSYMNGVSGGGLNHIGDLSKTTIDQLGLHLAITDYLLLGMALFMGILVALAFAMILGTFAEDIKSVQGLITPLMILVIIPYMVSLLLDINSMTPITRYIFYAIPFSHAFLAAPSLFLHQPLTVIMGIAYLALWFLVLVVIAAKIFTTDRIITLKVNLGKKRIPIA
jgi:ABC-2 type transport system permease protein